MLAKPSELGTEKAVQKSWSLLFKADALNVKDVDKCANVGMEHSYQLCLPEAEVSLFSPSPFFSCFVRGGGIG